MQHELGYYFHPSSWAHLPGHPQLDVHLYYHPTLRHYDPERADYPIVGSDGSLEKLHLTPNWRGSPNYRIGIGRIILHDRRGKIVEAFSFGGQLTITNQETYTLCTLTSPAPIWGLVTPYCIESDLASEVEALLARQEADWAVHHRPGFSRRLAQLDPWSLFMACLWSVEQALAEIPDSAQDDPMRQEEQVIHKIRRMIQTTENNTARPLPLDKLLSA